MALKRNDTLAYETNFAKVESVKDGRVEFSFDLSPERWPWLSLPPQHHVLLEKYQYFISITTGWATGLFEPTTYSALTSFKWHCPQLHTDCSHGSKEVCSIRVTDRGALIDIDIYDNGDRHLARMECLGAEFGDRDFKSWRASSRAKVLEQAEEADVRYAASNDTGVGRSGISFVSELNNGKSATARITSQNGFQPQHPFHSGSGDHVNVGHYFDSVMQVAHLVIQPTAALKCIGGESTFMRFTELDVPFEIDLLEQSSENNSEKLSFLLRQAGQDTARIAMWVKE